MFLNSQNQASVNYWRIFRLKNKTMQRCCISTKLLTEWHNNSKNPRTFIVMKNRSQRKRLLSGCKLQGLTLTAFVKYSNCFFSKSQKQNNPRYSPKKQIRLYHWHIIIRFSSPNLINIPIDISCWQQLCNGLCPFWHIFIADSHHPC